MTLETVPAGPLSTVVCTIEGYSPMTYTGVATRSGRAQAHIGACVMRGKRDRCD